MSPGTAAVPATALSKAWRKMPDTAQTDVVTNESVSPADATGNNVRMEQQEIERYFRLGMGCLQLGRPEDAALMVLAIRHHNPTHRLAERLLAQIHKRIHAEQISVATSVL